MSSLYVREHVRQWAALASEAMGVPFYDTVNREQDPGVPMWSTAEFLNAVSSVSTYCKTEEAGVVDILFFARGGGGDAELLAKAEPAMEMFMSAADPTGKLQLNRSGPPEDFPAGGGVPWFVVLFPVDYIYQPLKGV